MTPEIEVRPAKLPDVMVVINGRAYLPQYRPDPEYYCKGCALAHPVFGGNGDCVHPDATTLVCWTNDPTTGMYNFQWREIIRTEIPDEL